MNGSDLGLERRVDETVSRKHSLAFELRGDNHSLECLSTATYMQQESVSVRVIDEKDASTS
jgi:hypothetical protein